MRHEEFQKIFEERVETCRLVLIEKASEYATSKDRLHNFKKAAALNGVSVAEALWGMQTKHLISLADMVQDDYVFAQDVWDEKIGDALNYLFLLDAVIKDEKISLSQGNSGHKV